MMFMPSLLAYPKFALDGLGVEGFRLPHLQLVDRELGMKFAPTWSGCTWYHACARDLSHCCMVSLFWKSGLVCVNWFERCGRSFSVASLLPRGESYPVHHRRWPCVVTVSEFACRERLNLPNRLAIPEDPAVARMFPPWPSHYQVFELGNVPVLIISTYLASDRDLPDTPPRRCPVWT